jgi:hypothetical protein
MGLPRASSGLFAFSDWLRQLYDRSGFGKQER